MKGKILKTFKSTTAIVLVVVMLFAMLPNLSITANAATLDITTGQWVKTKVESSGEYFPDGSSYSSHRYEINNSIAYCLNPSKPGPSGDSVWIKYSVVPDKKENLKKALYYYQNGDLDSTMDNLIEKYWFSNNSGTRFLLIHYACAKLYGDKNWSYGLATADWETAVTSLANTISKKANTPDDFVAYYATPRDDSYQILVFAPRNTVTLTKVDSTDSTKLLPGATFRLYFDDGTRVVGRGTYTTNSKGVITVKNLPPGKYRFTETEAPDGYEKSNSSIYFTIQSNGGTSSVSNAKITFKNVPYIRLKLQKISTNTSAKYSTYKGAKYGVYTDSSCTKQYGKVISTNADGDGWYGGGTEGVDVPYRTYYTKETTAPKGFQLSTTIYKFVDSGKTTSDGRPIYIPSTSGGTVSDNPLIKLQLLKRSANPDITNGNSCYSLSGAVYTVYTDMACTKEAGMQLKTNADGYAAYKKGEEDDINSDIKDKNLTALYKKNAGLSIALPKGTTYYCKETTVPPGYKLDNTVYQFKDSGRVSSYGIRIFRAYSTTTGSEPSDKAINDPVGILLQKRNAVTGETVNQGLEGAIFQVQYYSQVIDKNYDVASGEAAPALDTSTLKRTWYIKTDEDGTSWLLEDYLVDNETYLSDDFYYIDNNPVPCVPIGTVVIKEVEAPAGYFKSDITFYRPVSEERAIFAQDTNTPMEIPIDEPPASGYIGIHKMNNSRVGVGGAKYGLYSDNTATTLVATLVTDSNGEGVFEYAAEINQTYYIKEVEAPPGYPLDSTIYPVVVTEENTTVETAVIQDIYEDSVKGNIEIVKSSNDGANSNLWFAVTDNLGNEYNAVATDENGKATVTGLPVYGADGVKLQYTVKELGYKTELGEHSYGGYTWTVKAENCILYKGAYYEGVANATFTDCDYAYSRFYYGNSTTATQNANGKTQTLTDNGTVTYSFVNTVPTTDLELYKTSFNGEVEGFYFDIVDQFGKSYGEIKTDDGGYACFSEQVTYNTLYSCIRVPNSSICIPMSYKAVEIGLRTPSGQGTYYLPDYYVEAVETELTTPTLSSNSLITFDVYNEADTGQIDIVKSSDDGDIADICFKLSAYEDDTEYSGKIYDAPIGFDESGEPVYSIILKTDSEGKATTANYTLYDINGNPLDGVLVYVDGTYDWQITYEITELGYDNGDGTYTLPSRYVPNEPYQFNLLEQRTVSYTCHNTVVSGSLQIQKTSEDDIVDSFWFKVTADSIGYESIVSTDGTGHTDIFNDLPVYVPSVQNYDILVEYTITELGFATENEDGTTSYAVPNRYNKPKSVTITLDTENVVIANIHNTLKLGSVTLYKQDSDGNGLSGSQWALYNADDDTLVKLIQTGTGSYINQDTGTEMNNLKTSTTGELYIYNLKQGDYYFVETKSAPGCMPYAEKVYFSIVPAETTVLRSEVIVTNNKEFLSQTGGTGTKNYLMLGCFSLITAIATISIYSKKRKMKGEKIL